MLPFYAGGCGWGTALLLLLCGQPEKKVCFTNKKKVLSMTPLLHTMLQLRCYLPSFLGPLSLLDWWWDATLISNTDLVYFLLSSLVLYFLLAK